MNSKIKPRVPISWDDYFMSMALLSSFRSKDPKVQVGACIVDCDNKVVSVGYNGMPTGCIERELSWDKDSGSLNDKLLYVVHAELNAILNSTRSLKGCRIYVSLFPCNECAKAIIQAGINEVIYLTDPKAGMNSVNNLAAKKLFDLAGVSYKQYSGNIKNLSLEIN